MCAHSGHVVHVCLCKLLSMQTFISKKICQRNTHHGREKGFLKAIMKKKMAFIVKIIFCFKLHIQDLNSEGPRGHMFSILSTHGSPLLSDKTFIGILTVLLSEQEKLKEDIGKEEQIIESCDIWARREEALGLHS